MQSTKDYHHIAVSNNSEEISLHHTGTLYLYSEDFDEEGNRKHYYYNASKFPSIIKRLENPETRRDKEFLEKVTKLIKNQGSLVKR